MTTAAKKHNLQHLELNWGSFCWMPHFLLFQVSLCYMLGVTFLNWNGKSIIMTITFLNTAFFVIMLSVMTSSAVLPHLANSKILSSCYWLVGLNKTKHKRLNRKWQQQQKHWLRVWHLAFRVIIMGVAFFIVPQQWSLYAPRGDAGCHIFNWNGMGQYYDHHFSQHGIYYYYYAECNGIISCTTPFCQHSNLKFLLLFS